jgi:hypothetical protein
MPSHLKDPISDNIQKKSITEEQIEISQAILSPHTVKRTTGAQSSLSHTEIMQLQRTLGNRRVSNLLNDTNPVQTN